MPTTSQVCFRVNASDLSKLKCRAESLGLGMSEYCRQRTIKDDLIEQKLDWIIKKMKDEE